jgi:hypothetical protein
LKPWREAESLEPIDKIVGEQQEMEVELVGWETVGWYLGQGITFFQLPDHDFDRCPGPIEIPNLFCSEREIGYKDLIGVTLQSEKRQLFGVFLGEGAADDYKTMSLLPPERFVEKLGRSPVFLEPVITKGSDFVSDRAGHLGYDGIAHPLLIQRLDKFVIEKTRIGSYPDPINARRNFSQTFFEEFRSTGRGINVSRSQKTMPKLSGMIFETE